MHLVPFVSYVPRLLNPLSVISVSAAQLARWCISGELARFQLKQCEL